MEKIKLICFDVDGTLVDGNSWLILAEGLGCSSRDAFDIFNRARKGEISFIEGERLLTSMFQSSGNANKTFIKNLFDGIEVKIVARDLISYLKKRGYKIYLISGAIDIYVEFIAKKLDLDGFYANSSLEFDNKGVLQRINYRDKQGEVKAEQLQDLIRKLRINSDQLVFIGDSENDVEVFKNIKYGIAINSTHEELKRFSWRALESLLEIKNIL